MQVVNNPLHHYHDMGYNMLLKVHVLHSHLNFFAENLSDAGGKHGKRFHQDISVMEKHSIEKWNPGMLADYCCNIIKEDNTIRKRFKRTNVV